MSVSCFSSFVPQTLTQKRQLPPPLRLNGYGPGVGLGLVLFDVSGTELVLYLMVINLHVFIIKNKWHLFCNM